MKFVSSFGRIISGHSFNLDSLPRLRVAITHHLRLGILHLLGSRRIGNHRRSLLAQRLDRLQIQMIAMRMTHQNQVGLGEGTIIGILRNRIDLNLFSIIAHSQTTMTHKRNGQLLARGRTETIRSEICRHHTNGHTQSQTHTYSFTPTHHDLSF